MVTAVINLDFIPLFFFFFIYSALEILISRTMEDHRLRFIQIEDEEFEDEELDEFEDEDEDDDRERERHLFPERIIFPVDLDAFNTGELEDDDEFDDYEDEDDDDDEEEYGDEDEMMPVARMLRMDPIEDDDYGDEDEDYEDEDDYEGEDEEDYEEEEELFPDVMTSPRVSSSVSGGVGGGLGGVVEDLNENSNEAESCEGKCGRQEKCGGGESHGSICPICFEAWTGGGEHQICCLPCGHIYGLSCIKKWLQQSRSSGKCPQCNNICTFKDVRVLYASRLCAADEELHKRVRSLEARCAYLEQKAGPLSTDELIDQICSNPAAVRRLATVLADLYQPPFSP